MLLVEMVSLLVLTLAGETPVVLRSRLESHTSDALINVHVGIPEMPAVLRQDWCPETRRTVVWTQSILDQDEARDPEAFRSYVWLGEAPLLLPMANDSMFTPSYADGALALGRTSPIWTTFSWWYTDFRRTIIRSCFSKTLEEEITQVFPVQNSQSVRWDCIGEDPSVTAICSIRVLGDDGKEYLLRPLCGSGGPLILPPALWRYYNFHDLERFFSSDPDSWPRLCFRSTTDSGKVCMDAQHYRIPQPPRLGSSVWATTTLVELGQDPHVIYAGGVILRAWALGLDAKNRHLYVLQHGIPLHLNIIQLLLLFIGMMLAFRWILSSLRETSKWWLGVYVVVIFPLAVFFAGSPLLISPYVVGFAHWIAAIVLLVRPLAPTFEGEWVFRTVFVQLSLLQTWILATRIHFEVGLIVSAGILIWTSKMTALAIYKRSRILFGGYLGVWFWAAWFWMIHALGGFDTWTSFFLNTSIQRFLSVSASTFGLIAVGIRFAHFVVRHTFSQRVE